MRQQTGEAAQRLVEQFEHFPPLVDQVIDQLAGDRGCHSPRNEKLTEKAGVKRIVLPEKGRLSPERQKHEKQRWFRRGMRFRSGCEARISLLKPATGWTAA